MHRRTLALALCAVPLLGADAPSPLPSVDAPILTGVTAPADFAVVIGIESYGFLPPVDYATRDADAFAAFLRDTRGVPRGRLVPLVGRVSGAQIRAALDEAGRATGAGGTVWVYFSGHGAANPTTAERVLLPVETTQDVPGFEQAGIPLSEIERRVTAGGARMVLITDACFGGAGRDRTSLLPGGHLAVPPTTRPPERGASWVATQANEVAVPLREARQGAFTYALLGALRGWADGAADGRRDGVVTSEEADAYVRSALRELGVTDQRPAWTGTAVELVRGKLEPAPALPRVAGTAPAPSAGRQTAPEVVIVGAAAASISDFDRELVEQTCVAEALRRGPELAEATLVSAAAEAAKGMSARWSALAARRDACLALGSVELRAPCIAQVEAFVRDAGALVVERSAGTQAVPVRLDASPLGAAVDCGVREVKVPAARRAVAVPEVAQATALLAALKTPGAPAVAPVASAAAVAPTVVLADTGVAPTSLARTEVIGQRAPGAATVAWSEGRGAPVVRIPAGSFTPGLVTAADRRSPPPEVEVGRDFLLLRFEVTQGLFEEVTGDAPAHHRGCGSSCPVENVSWLDAVAFANALSAKDGLAPAYRFVGDVVVWDRAAPGWRLPTEAEWELAARGGEDTKYAGGNALGAVAWHTGNSGGELHPVCLKDPNPYDLCDMSGNVAEWVWDGSGDGLSGGVDPSGDDRATARVLRGGGWDTNGLAAQVAYRMRESATLSAWSIGFRLARNAP